MKKSLETRINAMIPYFFLGPLVLFAKKNTPLAKPFVQNHAKRATIIMTIGLISFIVYLFIKPLIDFVVFGYYGPTVILAIIEGILFCMLLAGMYQAFQGIEIENLFTWKHPINAVKSTEKSYSEEEKIRIVASFIPLVGIFLAAKYKNSEIQIGAKMGNLFLVIITIIQLIVGSISSVGFLTSLIYIVFFVTNAVYIFGHSKFLSFAIYRFVPTWHEIEAHIRSSTRYVIEFIKVAFGGKKDFVYMSHFQNTLDMISRKVPPKDPFWRHPLDSWL